MFPNPPSFAAQTFADYQAALNAWKDTVIALHSLSAVPTLPHNPNAIQTALGGNTAKLAGDKCGPNETTWREANPGKRAPKFTAGRTEQYGSKENFFAALLKGETLEGEPEPETPAGVVFDDEDT